eukprot:1143207-Pelagomonas_calceolata.AAC.8
MAARTALPRWLSEALCLLLRRLRAGLSSLWTFMRACPSSQELRARAADIRGVELVAGERATDGASAPAAAPAAALEGELSPDGCLLGALLRRCCAFAFGPPSAPLPCSCLPDPLRTKARNQANLPLGRCCCSGSFEQPEAQTSVAVHHFYVVAAAVQNLAAAAAAAAAPAPAAAVAALALARATAPASAAAAAAASPATAAAHAPLGASAPTTLVPAAASAVVVPAAVPLCLASSPAVVLAAVAAAPHAAPAVVALAAVAAAPRAAVAAAPRAVNAAQALDQVLVQCFGAALPPAALASTTCSCPAVAHAPPRPHTRAVAPPPAGSRKHTRQCNHLPFSSQNKAPTTYNWHWLLSETPAPLK